GYPVGFLTGAAAPERIRLEFDSGLSDLQIVLREYVGLAVYYLRGRTDALFPKP
ncbi:MAG: YdcF family protein, partial [Alphaproteobacteria bacterium]|nr:YdcF family protein [Alphaproteobacteria bacterium]